MTTPPTLSTKALGELRDSVDGRLKVIETKSIDSAKLTDRLDKLEAKLNRPAANDNNGAANDDKKIETKAFGKFLRGGREVPGRRRNQEPHSRRRSARRLSFAPAIRCADRFANWCSFLRCAPQRASAQRATLASCYPLEPESRMRSGKAKSRQRPSPDPAFAQVEIPVCDLKTYADVSVKLLEDSAIDLEAELSDALAKDFGKKEGTSFVNGSGVKQPRGIMAHPAVSYYAGGNASALTAAGIIDLFHAVPPAYRQVGAWMMNSTTVGAVRNLVTSGSGAPLWVDLLAAGNPPTILGRPVIEAIDMPSVAANAFPIVFGDFNSAYRIYDRIGMTLLRDPFTQATNGLVRFHARRRVGGDVVLPEAILKLKIATS